MGGGKMACEDRRILSITVTGDLAGITVRDLMKQKLGFSARLMSRVKYRAGGILLNGKPARAAALLAPGDELRLDITDPDSGKCVWVRPEPFLPPEILYEDEDLLILQKPSGLVCHPSFGHYADTLANAAAVYLGYENRAREIHMIGRLDRDTSGLVVIAKNSGAADSLFKQQEEKAFRKVYLAGAIGRFGGDIVIDRPIGRIPGVLMLRQACPEGKPAKTRCRALAVSGNEVLTACTLEQGRTHQIRVHLASEGHPLAGDLLYGPGGAREAFLATGDPGVVRIMNEAGSGGELHLCAYMAVLRQPFTGKILRVTARYPRWAETFGPEKPVRKKVEEILTDGNPAGR
jgi:23S rRNA pseudouridine1911/1915/1917 synthase